MNNQYVYGGTSPGETIKDILDKRDISVRDFAVSMDMPLFQLYRLLDGDMELDLHTAIGLETIFGINRQFWLNIENNYRNWVLNNECRY